MNNKNISLNYYKGCIDNKRRSIERKYKDEKDRFFEDLARNSGIGTYGSRQRAKKIIDIKKKLIKEIIILMEKCSIKSLCKKSPKELTEEEFDYIGNKIEKDFLKYVNEKITSSDELKNYSNIDQYGLSKALQEIDEEAKVLIDNIKRKFELIRQEKEILKQKIKIENLKAIPRNFDEHNYGYGIAISWNPLKSEYLKYYQIQWSNDKINWQDYERMREAGHGAGVNFHGKIIHKENGKKYTNCLPSGQKFYFRVRALDTNGEPISKWSDIAEGTANTYKIRLPEIKIETDLPAKKFPFVADKDLKKIIKRDYDEIRRIKDSGAFKAIMVMCGSVMEALLFDALIQKRKNAMKTTSAQKIFTQHKHKKKIEDFTLEDCIDVAYELGIIKDVPLERYPDDLRKYRNFIHALNEKEKEYEIGQEKANMAINALKLIIKSISSNLKNL